MVYDFGFGYSLMDTVFPALFVLVFCLVLGIIIVSIVRGIGEWGRNNQSPRLTVEAAVVAKRTSVSGGGQHGMASTTYYVTFQVESGDRMELRVSGGEYGMLAEGDTGRLSFQGSRYLGFERA